MGCCFTADKHFIPHFRQMTPYEVSEIKKTKIIRCTICREFIRTGEPVTECSFHNKIIGHDYCVSVYSMNNIKCPFCNYHVNFF
jgi:hypothetical protein